MRMEEVEQVVLRRNVGNQRLRPDGPGRLFRKRRPFRTTTGTSWRATGDPSILTSGMMREFVRQVGDWLKRPTSILRAGDPHSLPDGQQVAELRRMSQIIPCLPG